MYIESSATQNTYFRDVVALIKLLNEPLHDTASMGSCLVSPTSTSASCGCFFVSFFAAGSLHNFDCRLDKSRVLLAFERNKSLN